MPVIVVTSVKGGVGKTTIAANLIVGLRSFGWDVLAVDLDPQNSLHLHLGLEPQNHGLGPSLLAHGDWRANIRTSSHGIRILPFGTLLESQHPVVERLFLDTIPEINGQLSAFGRRPGQMVVIDTSPGYSPYCDKVLAIADLRVRVLLADAASYAAVALQTEMDPTDGRTWENRHVINQYYADRQLSRDVFAAFEERFGMGMVSKIHADQAVAEALAHRQTVLFHDPASQATKDLLTLSLSVDRLFDRLEASVRRSI